MTHRGRLVLAPMEGVADDVLRDAMSRVGGYDWSVTEFVRVSGSKLPDRVFTRISPELLNGGRTRAGTPVRVQLLGSDPECLALNAAALAALGPFGIDLNFGCPAPTVNRHRGGAALLGEPELLGKIVGAVRAAVPPELIVSAKMRLGINDTGLAIACAQALEAGGAQELVVHARTKADGYRPPAKWHCVTLIQQSLSIPVIGNGDVFTVDDFHRLREITGCEDVMLGRGAIADPFLAQRIRGLRAPNPGSWAGKAATIVVPAEPPQDAPRTAAVTWTNPTLPRHGVFWHTPAASVKTADAAIQQVLGSYLAGATSPLYKSLVLEKQIVESVGPDYSEHRDPNLFGISATLKDEAQRAETSAAIDAAVAELLTGKIDTRRVNDIKDHIRYGLPMGLETHADVAQQLSYLGGILGTPEAIELRQRAIIAVKPADLVSFAKKYLVEKNRTTLVFKVEVSKEGAK